MLAYGKQTRLLLCVLRDGGKHGDTDGFMHKLTNDFKSVFLNGLHIGLRVSTL